MYQVKLVHLLTQSAFHTWSPEQSPQEGRSKVPHPHALQVHWLSQWDTRVASAVNVGGEHAHVVTGLRQRLAQPMHRLDRAAIAGGGEIARDYVQDSQGQGRLR